MKICRFITSDSQIPRYGALLEQTIEPFLTSDIFQNDFRTDAPISLAEAKLLPPVTPSKIVCIGRNYAEHAKELGNEVPKEPLLFLKAPSSLINDKESIIIPNQSEQVEHEGELAVVIGRLAKNINDDENPLDYIFGYCCLNDVTARDLQRKDVQFTRAKSFDTFCPISSFVETDFDGSNADVRVRVNGVTKQNGNTNQMVFSVSDLIRYVSNQMTLLPGDLIATGTPSGVSKLNPGDTVEVEIQGIGVLSNPVRKSDD
jgi:2-keto-4-pentenoate hydratase/2-oxohepta-3-ene-1,7-dioic acid hydratase in catechol pathway